MAVVELENREQIAAFLRPGTPMDVVWISDELLATTHGDTNPAQLRVYRFDRGTLTLTQVELKSAGSFRTYLAIDPSRRYLYISAHWGSLALTPTYAH